jgi:glycosyltransferase involved in cell wall biosynthesis
VCVITTVHTPYDGRILFKECASLARVHDVTMLCFFDSEPEEREGVRIKPMPKPKNRLARVLAGRRMVAAAVAEHADIYHFHDPEFLFQAGRLAKLTGKPVIYDCHENYPITFDQKTYLPAWIRPIAAWVVDKLEKRVTPRLAATVVADEDLAGRFEPFASKVVLVKNYPALQHMPDPDFDYPRKPWAIYVGLITEVRGMDKLLEAFALVHREMPDAMLVLVGDNRLDPQKLGAFIERYGLTRSVDDKGFMPYSHAMPLVQRCRVGISPMPHHEKFRRNLATKVFDYMGAGTPYVASDWGAIAQTVKGKGGMLVDTEDPKEIARGMLTYLMDDDLARKTGAEGRAAVEREFNWEGQEKKLLALYEDLLGEAREEAVTAD